jgi:hypothetical protein
MVQIQRLSVCSIGVRIMWLDISSSHFVHVKEYKVLMILMGVSNLCLETTKAIFMEFQ